MRREADVGCEPGPGLERLCGSERPNDGVPLADEARLDNLGDVEGILVQDALDVGLALGVDEEQGAGDLANEGTGRNVDPLLEQAGQERAVRRANLVHRLRHRGVVHVFNCVECHIPNTSPDPRFCLEDG